MTANVKSTLSHPQGGLLGEPIREVEYDGEPEPLVIPDPEPAPQVPAPGRECEPVPA
jgi:hypothetical protein